jgi:hypothetical protein
MDRTITYLLTAARSPKTYVLLGLVVAAVAIPALQPLFSDAAAPPPPPKVTHLSAEQCVRRVIYHSPQRPGYTAWTGAWVMADQSLMMGFTQATGPVSPARRASAPQGLKERLGVGSQVDFWGLRLSSMLRRSVDGGATWSGSDSDRFKAVYPNGYSAGADIGLRDGSVLRRVNGWDQMQEQSLPRTAYLQRLAPGKKQWSTPQVLMDPRRYVYQIGRIRRLRDGRLIALGQYWEARAGSPRTRLESARAGFLLMVSEDEGRTWRRNPVDAARGGSYLSVGEWDAAELANGDLLAVFRTRRSSSSSVQERRQAILRKVGRGWELTRVHQAPLPHSGHPELLATREGAVLHIATTGVHWTSNGGRSWRPLGFASSTTSYGSTYYPRSLQTRDGTVYVFGHRGADDPYGQVDQAIVMDKFRLSIRTDVDTGVEPETTFQSSATAGSGAC